MLTRSGESRHPGLFSYLKGRAFSLSPLSDVSYGVFIDALYHGGKFHPIPILFYVSYYECVLGFVQCFLCVH